MVEEKKISSKSGSSDRQKFKSDRLMDFQNFQKNTKKSPFFYKKKSTIYR